MIVLFYIQNVYSQNNSNNYSIKRDSMEYFNIDKYKDWEVDESHSTTEGYKFLKRGNDRIEICYNNEGILVRFKNIKKIYSVQKGFSNDTKRLIFIADYFGQIEIGIDKEYNENGQIIKETNNELPYNFTLKQVIEKIKKEEMIDLEDRTQGGVLSRFVYKSLNNKPFYKVSLQSKKSELKRDYLIIDGNTGELLFRTIRYFPTYDEDKELSPFDEYLSNLKKKEAEDNAYYKSYKGKDYAKKEWEIFVEKFHENYQKNKKRSFWDDIFSRSTDD